METMKTALFFIILISTVLIGNCQTIIPGGSVSGTWTMAGSPYIIQGAIMIANDSTLTIEPGVMVEFQGSYKFLVLGQLLALGNPTDSITMTAANTTNGWLGIRFENTASTNDTSRIEYCKIQYGKAIGTSPNDCGGAFYFSDFSKAIISNSSISNCYADDDGGGIYCLNSNPNISNNSIKNNTSDSGGGGIFCDNSSPLIISNTISDNLAHDGAGIACESSSNPSIINNIITNNSGSNCCGGIFCQNSNSFISGNTISYIPSDSTGATFAGLIGAAVNRGVLYDPSRWGMSSPPNQGLPEYYYVANPDSNAGQFNQYSKVLHEFSLDGLCYGHSYDDYFSQAAALSVNSGESVTITVLSFE